MQQTNARGLWKSCPGLLFAVSVFLIVDAKADTWWVDDDNYNAAYADAAAYIAAGYDGTTAEKAFGTIQIAVDKAGIGDTINVKAGVYNRGATQNTTYGGVISNRVVIAKKVHIKAVEGREKTFIVGAADPNGDSNGLGSNATRCILYCDDQKYSSGGAIVEGFTICGGRTLNSETGYGGYGAGMLDSCDGSKGRYQIWLVDCTISNCIARAGGATRFGSMYRSFVTDCKGTGRVSGIHGTRAHSSIIAHCTENGTSYGLAIQVTAVNSTFFANRTCLGPTSGSNMPKLYNCIVAGDGAYEPSSVTASTTTATDGFYQLFAPAVGDYRPLPDSRAATLGNASYLTGQVNVIDEAKPLINGVRTLVDYAGNPYPASGTIAAGAVQEIAPAPAGGALQFDIDQCTVNGNIAHSGAYVYPETYPMQYVLAATEKQVYCYWRKVGSATEMVVPRMDDTALLMPPPSIAEVSTNTVQYAVAELYIDPVNGNDANNGSSAAPFKTLQKGFDAVRSSSDYKVVHAAAGEYREGGAPIHPEYNNPDGPAVLTNRLCIGTGRAVRFKGAGAGRSFIYGAPDPDTVTGLGPAAIRPLCIYSANSIVQGFTLADGYSGNTGKTTATYRSDDFIVYGRADSTPAHVADCIVTNCHAARAITIYVNWCRSKFIDNSSIDAPDDGGAWINYSGTMESCAFIGNRYRAGSSGLCRACYSCSFSGDAQSDIPFANGYVVGACVVDGCKQLRDGTLHRGSVADHVTTAFNYAGVVNDVAGFVDAAHGDFRVKSYSGATRCVPAPGSDTAFWADYWRHACGDLDGNPLKIFPDGGFLAGAVQEIVNAPGKVYVRAPKGGLGDGSSAYANGEYDIGGGTLALSPAAGTRPCIGFTVDGVTNLFADASSWPISVSAAASGSLVGAVYGTDWYVDGENGNDANYGYLPSIAKKTLAAALGASGIASGDTVHAAAGTYAEGVMTNGVNTQMGSRAIVPEGVMLKGAGATNTFIVGAIATVGSDDYGCGTNAVRCVALNRYATVQGFTLTGGRTCCHAGGKTLSDNLGAGVVGVGTSVTATTEDRNVIDCVISNNIAYRGGGAAYVSLCRSLVTGNRGTDSTGQASGTYYCSHYGSIVANQLAQYNAMYPYSVCESTLRENDDGYWAFYNHNSGAPVCEIRNSLILGKSQIVQPDSIATNSYFSRTPTITSGRDVIGPGSLVASAATLQVDGDFRPVIGANVAIDKGDISLVPEVDRTTDLLGGQRVYNGALDVGAVEADWRAKYAVDLSSSRRFEVTEASAGVVETGSGAVQLAAGETFAARWNGNNARRHYAVTLDLAADSAVTVTLDGVSTTYDTVGRHEFKFDGADNPVTLQIACTVGTADLLAADVFTGMVISVR